MNTALTSQTADIQMIRDKTLPTDNWNRFSIIDIFCWCYAVFATVYSSFLTACSKLISLVRQDRADFSWFSLVVCRRELPISFLLHVVFPILYRLVVYNKLPSVLLYIVHTIWKV